MEEKLRKLMEANREENREEIAKEYKKQGGKIIGVLHATVPEEILYAAGLFPYRVSGTWTEDVALATYWRPSNFCRFNSHVLQAALTGKLDFLDGMVLTYWDDDTRRLWDVLKHIEFKPFLYILHSPSKNNSLAVQYFTHGLQRMASAVLQFSRVRVTDKNLANAITVYNKWRDLLGRLYELRKRVVPPISGAECLAITTASFVMPKDKFNEELEALLPYLETRETHLKSHKPRLLVSSDSLDNPAYMELIESVGALVAMDDTDTGSRYFVGKVRTDCNPMQAIAERYLVRPPDPRMVDWAAHMAQIEDWVKEYKIDGVVNLPHANSQYRLCMVPFFKETLTVRGIPNVTFVREYHLANVEQLRTRIGAFVETLG